VLGVVTVITSSVLGIAIAFLLMRFEFRAGNLFSYLTMIPIISPPLVGVLGSRSFSGGRARSTFS
jgi:ABC-type Fe3+ transport system permease subunit